MECGFRNATGNAFGEFVDTGSTGSFLSARLDFSIYSNVSRFSVSHAPCHNQDVQLSAIMLPENEKL